MVRAATSTSTRPFCPTASECPTTRSPPRAQRLPGVVRPPHGGDEGLSANRNGRQAMTAVGPRFTLLQRVLHWLMAACILAMLFIGVGMVSTIMPKYLTLVSIHKPLGIAILVLALVRLAIRLRYGAPALPVDLPEPMKLAAQLSHYAFYVLMIFMPLIGWGMLSAAAYPIVLFGGVHLPPILPQSDSLHTLL